MDDHEILDHLDSLLDTSVRRGQCMADVINGRVVRVDPGAERFKVDHAGGLWESRDAVLRRISPKA